MLNFSKIKVVLIYLSFLAVSFFCFSNISDSNNFFLKKKINLGLDLQGGSYLLLEVDSTPLQKRQIQSKVIPLKKKLIEKNINYKNFKIKENIILFEININDKEKFENFFKDKNNDINIYLNQYRSFELDYIFEKNLVKIFLSKNGIIKLNTSAVDQSIEIVRKRIDETGTKEPSIIKRGSNRILVELPGIKDPERIKELLGKTAQLSFRMVTDDKTEFGIETFILKDTQEKISVSKRIILTGDNLIDANPKYDNINQEPIVAFTLNRLGSQRFGQATSKILVKDWQ